MSLAALRAVLERRKTRKAETPEPAPGVDADAIVNPIVLELRDLKATLQKHHDSGARISPG